MKEELLEKKLDMLPALGVTLVSNIRIGTDVTLEELHGQTNIPYVFAGGDAVKGADLVATAIADGKHAATWLLHYLDVLGACLT